MRQGKVAEEKKIPCSTCGAIPPRHFLDCPSVPGGEVLYFANLEERRKWDEEKTVLREQGARILKAIEMMMYSPGDNIMHKRRVAILDEIGKL